MCGIRLMLFFWRDELRFESFSFGFGVFSYLSGISQHKQRVHQRFNG